MILWVIRSPVQRRLTPYDYRSHLGGGVPIKATRAQDLASGIVADAARTPPFGGGRLINPVPPQRLPLMPTMNSTAGEVDYRPALLDAAIKHGHRVGGLRTPLTHPSRRP